jgi:murein L,D-transpeptidase YcbB/YkuD
MIVLRFALLLGALAAAAPAAAATDVALLGARETSIAWNQVLARLATAKVQAVEAALDQAKDGGEPIERAVLEGVRGFYEARGFRPLWFEAKERSAQMVALRRSMDGADQYGLDPAAYATPLIVDRRYYDPDRLAAADVEFSRTVARFVTHIASGSIQPTDISRLITLEPERPDLGEALSHLARAPSPGAALDGYEPQPPQYQALKRKLAELRTREDDDQRIVVPEGASLKPGMSDARVSLLRKRLGVDSGPEATPDLYDGALVDAVEAFQGENGLGVDGIVGPATLSALNGRSREEDIASILANMERWRWMPRDLGKFYVMVNVPEFLVRAVDDGTVVHETRVIVGKPRNPTPTFSNTISHLIVNPYWNVPLSILKNEMLPEIGANPNGYFARYGYEVLANVGGRTRQINPGWVDWRRVNPRALHVRQVPGDHNALGRIKFMFPNQHSVYLHDTPTKSLFARDRRAFSHGCVRVQNPLEFADALLPVAAPQWNSSRLKQLYGSQERRVNLDNPVPVHITYFTTTIGPGGELRHFEDVYGYDGKMTEFLGF